jgi:hypothetical protein
MLVAAAMYLRRLTTGLVVAKIKFKVDTIEN